ncbi:MAG: phosphoenolpyruvate carboxykinase (GTP) [Candidatus Lokiarchaeota archaeon]|nr:phosphoenolpyruvate carboxykinase (GTP) [Candidatus Lokiarchaeota archaeon]
MDYLKEIEGYVTRGLLSETDFEKLNELNNKKVLHIIHQFVDLCNPSKLTVVSDSEEDITYVRQNVVKKHEESKLNINGHTVHFDGFVTMSNHDQARDKGNTKILIPKGGYKPPALNTIDREEGLEEILKIMEGCMKGKECIIRFFCLGPKNSKFSILSLQLTDSLYVAHSEDLLYRAGYEEFKKLNNSEDFFYFIHSAGELTGDPPVTKNLKNRRIYVDLKESRVLSVNNQYAGNSLGLKKLALRLAIHKANNEDWLTEHYFIMGVCPKGKNRVSYFAGAYPSACGKTSTAMLPGQQIVGDDIAYLRSWGDGFAHAANIEKGIFGIIKDVNQIDDPVIYEALTTPRETIFSNVLIKDGDSYWLGMGKDNPKEGMNFSGHWKANKADENGNSIPFAHPNARYTIRLSELSNTDDKLEDPEGVPLHGIFYGGRDSDTMPPILQSLNWEHGIYLGATIESETTSATIGAEGVRKSNPMANLDFLVVPLGKYLKNHEKFGKELKYCPKVFSTNYFLKNEDGKYLNGILDKKIWIIWAEGRTQGDFEAIITPIGYIPLYEDLKNLFDLELGKLYSETDYIEQFSIRIKNILAKLERMEKMFKAEKDIPEFIWTLLNKQKNDLIQLMNDKGKDVIFPNDFFKK